LGLPRRHGGLHGDLYRYIYNAFSGKALTNAELTVIGAAFAFITGYIGYRGVSGSTKTSLWINVIQLTALVIFSGLAIWYRWSNPEHATAAQWTFSGGWDIVKFHSYYGRARAVDDRDPDPGRLESCTALAAETIEPEKTIPRRSSCRSSFRPHRVSARVLCRRLYAQRQAYGHGDDGRHSDRRRDDEHGTGMAAAAASSAPIGDLARLLGDHVLPGIGFGLMISIAITVVLPWWGRTLSCMNTAIRVTAVWRRPGTPEMLSFMHGKFSTPHMAMWVLCLYPPSSQSRGAFGGRTHRHYARLQLGDVHPLRADLYLDDRGLQAAQGL